MSEHENLINPEDNYKETPEQKKMPERIMIETQTMKGSPVVLLGAVETFYGKRKAIVRATVNGVDWGAQFSSDFKFGKKGAKIEEEAFRAAQEMAAKALAAEIEVAKAGGQDYPCEHGNKFSSCVFCGKDAQQAMCLHTAKKRRYGTRTLMCNECGKDIGIIEVEETTLTQEQYELRRPHTDGEKHDPMYSDQ